MNTNHDRTYRRQLGAALLFLAILSNACHHLERSAATATEVAAWRSYAVGHHRPSPAPAVVSIVEFSDFECPFCRRLAENIDVVLEGRPNVDLVFRNFPLTHHAHAHTAAIAGECVATNHGDFWRFHDAMFAHQESIGTIPWTEVARVSGVTDTVAFARCMNEPSALGTIRRDSLDAVRAGITGTPLVMIGPLRVNAAVSRQRLERLIDSAIVLDRREKHSPLRESR